MKETDESTSKLKDISHSWIRRIMKMSIVHEAIYRFSAITIKIIVAFSTEVEQAVLKLVWNHSRPRRAKTILRKKNKAGDITFPDFKPSYQSYRDQSITMNKVSGGGGIPVELFQILKDDAVKVLHSIYHQIWKTQQWPQD